MVENEYNEKSNNFEKNNQSEDNIDEKHNYYQDLQNNEENFYENRKIKEEKKRKNEIRLFYYSVLEFFRKKQYKKILDLFKTKDEESEKEEGEKKIIYQNEWIFPYLHLICIERVIQKKFEKNNKSSKMISIKKYIDMETIIINKWLLLINELNKENKKKNEDIRCFLEFTVGFILVKCIYMSKYCIYQENIKEAIYFLSLGIYLINRTYNCFKSPISFSISAELLIYLTSILIADSKYETAKNLIDFSIKLLYISLETIFFCNPEQLSFTMLNILSQEQQNIEITIKLIFYISISFYHLGVCYENQGNYNPSFYAYKQAKFFLSLIKDFSEDFYTLYDFIINVENRQLLRNRLILFFKKNAKKEKLIEEEKPKVKLYNAFTINKELKEQKFLKLEEYISNMNLIDVDNEDPHLFDKVDKVFKTNVNIATKQIHLLDYLMSDEFKDIINNMRKIKINKLDYETIHIIQRQIINIKNNEREKLSKKYKNKVYNQLTNKIRNIKRVNGKTINTISSSKTFNSGKKTRASSGYKNSETLLTEINKSEYIYNLKSRPATAKNDKLKNYKSKYFLSNILPKRSLTINTISYEQNLELNIPKKDSILLSYRYNKKNIINKIPKYSYDKFLFNKSFMRKKKDLEKQYNNELNFQKKFLKCKEKEISKPPPFSLKHVQTDCEKFYASTFDKEVMKIREKKFNFGNDFIKDLVRKKMKSIYNINKTISGLRKTRKFNQIYNNSKEESGKAIEENNYKYINNLMRDIEYIDNKKKYLVKNYRKNKNLKLENI